MFASGIFQRAPNLAQFLEYVCAKYFEGRQEQVKEYTIAIEALGRTRDFDQKRDSIVRVEAHRLRKRLIDYYEREGRTHRIKIVMPLGQYVPQFVRDEPVLVTQPAPSQPEAQPKRHVWARAVVAATVLLGVAGVLTVWFNRAPGDTKPALAGIPAGQDIRILAGWAGGPYTDPFGHIWQPDRYGSDGYLTDYKGHSVDGGDPRLFQTAREGDFGYDIPLAPGTYEMHLHFAEMLFGDKNVGGGAESSRIFSFDANGKRLLDQFDIISDAAGSNIADERVFKDISPDQDRLLHLRFTHLVRDPLLNAIEILPGIPGRLRPIRLVMNSQAYVDSAGNKWEADRYYRGGHLVGRPHTVTGTSDSGLYRSARCGNISYVIPVAPGTYSMTLRFAEGWVGTGNPVGGGVGSRLFNIYCNSQPLANNFDIYKEAGGAERATERTFTGLKASPQGKLVLYLEPVKSYACVNAIEIRDEGK